MFNFTESRVFSFLETLADMLILNFIFLISCLPIITIGTAITSMFEVTLKMVESKEGYIIASYVKAFRSNFKQATRAWISIFFIFIVLSVDLFYAFIKPSVFSIVLYIIVFGVGSYLMFTCCYLFALLAKFQDNWKVSMKNAFFMSIRHFPWTILILAVNISGFLSMLLLPRMWLYGIPYYTFLGFSMAAYITSYILQYIFKTHYGVEE